MSTPKPKKRDRGKRRTVTLAKPKQHGGRWHPEGTRLDLYPDQIERARRHGEIEE